MRDKVVIVTGASSGIGKALVYELARQKAKIAIASRNIEELLRIEEDLKKAKARTFFLYGRMSPRKLLVKN